MKNVASAVVLAAATFGSTALAANQVIQVGAGGQLAYSPPSITAAIGDNITFEFNPKNHTVTQSAFGTPCVPLVNGTQTGFDSGFTPVAANATQTTAWTIQVTSTSPIWFFCRQTGHCNIDGMVGAINAPTTGNKTFAAFQALATSGATASGSAGSPAPVGYGGTGSTNGGSGESAGTAATTGSSGSGTGAAAAALTGVHGVAAAAVAAIVAFFL